MKKENIVEKIIEAKEIFGEKAIPEIVAHYKIENFDEESKKGCCPFHSEKTPSFIWNKKDNSFKCFGCNKRASILDVYVELEGSYIKAVKRLCDETNVIINIGALNPDKSSYFDNYKYPEREHNTDRSIVNDYMSKRGISESTLDYFDIQQDSHGNVVFHMYDFNNTLLCKKYRLSHAPKVYNQNGKKREQPKMWWDTEASNCPILYGINKIDITKPIVICEGLIDFISIVEAGYSNVVSIPSGAEDTNWIEFNFEFLENFDTFILWYDNDNAGKKGLQKVISRIGEYKCKVVTPTIEHENKVEEYFKSFNSSLEVRKTDANNILLACGKKDILQLIEDAKEVPSKKLKYLMDCEVTSVANMEKFSYGIQAMDKILYGNIFSCFTIYSGLSGGGKSSLTNTASLISPIECGYKVFSFSGELSEGQFADWVVSNLAGYNHIIKIPPAATGGLPYYQVTKQAEDAIRSYYRTKVVLFSDEDALDVSGDALIAGMEEAYKRYGCRVFNIDNLMCIDFENIDNEDKWTSQKKFIIKLMSFTTKYDACVNLVLHPKKMQKGQSEITTSDLHGASEIGNLCHRMLWVERLKPEDGNMYNTRITVIKDRPTGRAGKHCDLFYDDKTRRFYTDNDECRKVYSWEKAYNITYNPDVDRDLIKYLPIDNQILETETDNPY